MGNYSPLAVVGLGGRVGTEGFGLGGNAGGVWVKRFKILLRVFRVEIIGMERRGG